MKEAILNERNKFNKYLTDTGLQFTKGRQIVFDEAMQAHGHFAAEDLNKQCKSNQRNVSRATVYRSIRELLEAGIIRKTAYGEKHQHFEHVYDEKLHHHAHCIKCHSYLEFPDLREDIPYQPILEKQGFHVLGHELHFYGICKNCLKQKNSL